MVRFPFARSLNRKAKVMPVKRTERQRTREARREARREATEAKAGEMRASPTEAEALFCYLLEQQKLKCRQGAETVGG
jgi:hypothetical protein